MSKISIKTVLKRDLTDVESKLLVGAGSSITVGAVVADSQHLFGYTPPLWLALVIVIAAFFVGGYLKGSTIPSVDDDPADAGSLETAASTVGADLAAGDPRAAADAALQAAGIVLAQPTTAAHVATTLPPVQATPAPTAAAPVQQAAPTAAAPVQQAAPAVAGVPEAAVPAAAPTAAAQ